MSKYIIENCGCNPSCDECYNNCEKITDCALKRIVEKCENTQLLSTKNRQDLYAVKVFANDLLQLLDIQEVE